MLGKESMEGIDRDGTQGGIGGQAKGRKKGISCRLVDGEGDEKGML